MCWWTAIDNSMKPVKGQMRLGRLQGFRENPCTATEPLQQLTSPRSGCPVAWRACPIPALHRKPHPSNRCGRPAWGLAWALAVGDGRATGTEDVSTGPEPKPVLWPHDRQGRSRLGGMMRIAERRFPRMPPMTASGSDKSSKCLERIWRTPRRSLLSSCATVELASPIVRKVDSTGLPNDLNARGEDRVGLVPVESHVLLVDTAFGGF